MQLPPTALDSEDPLPLQIGTCDVGQVVLVGSTTGHAPRALGVWPMAETIAYRLVDALDKAAEREPDKERKGFRGKAASYLGNADRDLAVEIGGDHHQPPDGDAACPPRLRVCAR